MEALLPLTVKHNASKAQAVQGALPGRLSCLFGDAAASTELC
jgi:hypothetical protein